MKVPADMLVCFLGLKLPHLRIGWAIAWHRMTGTEACLKAGYGKNQDQCLPTLSHKKTIQALQMQNTDTHNMRLVCHRKKEVQKQMS